MTVIAIIPARSGSKRLPRKNGLSLEPGISLVQHAINCAVDSGVIDHTLVLTDDRYLLFERAQILCEPSEDANDTTDIAVAVSHAADIVENSIGRFDYVVTLQPAVVARSPLIVRRVVEAVIEAGANGAVTAARGIPWRWKTNYPHGHSSWNDWHPAPYPRSNVALHCLDEVNAVQVASRKAVRDQKRWDTPMILAELPHWAAALDIDEPGDLVRVRDMWAWARQRLETCEPIMHRVESINGVEK